MELPTEKECYACWVVIGITYRGRSRADGFAQMLSNQTPLLTMTWFQTTERWMDLELGMDVPSLDAGPVLKVTSRTKQSLETVVQWDFWPEELYLESFPGEEAMDKKDALPQSM